MPPKITIELLKITAEKLVRLVKSDQFAGTILSQRSVQKSKTQTSFRRSRFDFLWVPADRSRSPAKIKRQRLLQARDTCPERSGGGLFANSTCYITMVAVFPSLRSDYHSTRIRNISFVYFFLRSLPPKTIIQSLIMQIDASVRRGIRPMKRVNYDHVLLPVSKRNISSKIVLLTQPPQRKIQRSKQATARWLSRAAGTRPCCCIFRHDTPEKQYISLRT